jgi:hypothetical protein
MGGGNLDIGGGTSGGVQVRRKWSSYGGLNEGAKGVRSTVNGP